MREIIGAAIFKGKKILLVKEGEEWSLPGRFREAGESELESLTKTANSQLSGVKITAHPFYREFVDSEIKIRIYKLELSGNPRKNKTSETQWARSFEGITLGKYSRLIINSLKTERYI